MVLEHVRITPLNQLDETLEEACLAQRASVQRLLPAAFVVVGAARQDLTSDQFRQNLHADLVTFSRTKPINEDVWRSFAYNVHYVSTKDAEGYETLRHTLADLDVRAGTNGNRLFYLATPPSAYGTIVDLLKEHRLTENVNARVVVEKPFGHDLASSRELNALVDELVALVTEQQGDEPERGSDTQKTSRVPEP